MSQNPTVCRPRSLAKLLPLGLLTAVGLLAAGCGGSGRYDVSGKVTYAGKPVPFGCIYFDPDVTKNKDGVQGYAEIKDGHYDTDASDKPPTSGSVIVRIEGFDGVPLDAERPNGKPLFTEYKTAVELPRGRTVKDFDIPAAAGYGQPVPGR